MAQFKVLREHQGDRPYVPGEVREGNAADFKHLMPHILEPADGEKAVSKSPKNKAVSAAPANKAETGHTATNEAGEAANGEEK